jgi:hypothetical protein
MMPVPSSIADIQNGALQVGFVPYPILRRAKKDVVWFAQK